MSVSAGVLPEPHPQVWSALYHLLGSRLMGLDAARTERSPVAREKISRPTDPSGELPVWLL